MNHTERAALLRKKRERAAREYAGDLGFLTTETHLAGSALLEGKLLEAVQLIEHVDCRANDVFSVNGRCLKCDFLSKFEAWLMEEKK